jgi:lantibiotic modifying enzyme
MDILLPDYKNIKRISQTLSQISEALKPFVKQDEDDGLLSGYCGTSLFYGYYYRLTGKQKYLTNIKCIARKTVDALAKKELMHSHCSGIAGMLWCIQQLVKNDFICQQEGEDIFEAADDYLFKIIKNELSLGQYDFLHEGLGIALYFLERLPNLKVQSYLEEVVLRLEKASVIDEPGITWRDYFTERNNADNKHALYNLGLAHGVPAILSVLTLLYEKGIVVKQTRALIENGVKWLMANKNDPGDDCVSLYPSTVTEGHKAAGVKQSRLGWCYGDLGIAITLLNIGNRLDNSSYKQESYSIFEHTLKYRNNKNGSIADASLCHGSAGVSQIFRRAYMASGERPFLEGAERWIEQTLQFASWKDGLAGFKYYTQKGYQNNHNLLEGITGIGLALIAAVDANTTPSWDRCLLLS